jgi:RNA polymerase sigma-70 factor (ECF subfamily)
MTKVIPIRGRRPADETLSSEALVAACAAGDAEALALLYDRYCDDVTRFLSRLTYVDRQDVGDLVQEVFLAVFRTAKSFRRQSNVKTWLFAIVANIAKDAARKGTRFRAFKHGVSEAQGRMGETSREPPSIDYGLRRKLQELLHTLPHDLRVAFVMCDIEEVSGVEAARELGVPEGTLYRRLHQARQALRAALKEDGQ